MTHGIEPLCSRLVFESSNQQSLMTMDISKTTLTEPFLLQRRNTDFIYTSAGFGSIRFLATAPPSNPNTPPPTTPVGEQLPQDRSCKLPTTPSSHLENLEATALTSIHYFPRDLRANVECGLTVLMTGIGLANWLTEEGQRFQQNPIGYITSGAGQVFKEIVRWFEEMGKDLFHITEAISGPLDFDPRRSVEKLKRSLEEFWRAYEVRDVSEASQKASEIGAAQVQLRSDLVKWEIIIKPTWEIYLLYKFLVEGMVQDIVILADPEANCLEKEIAKGFLILNFVPANDALVPVEQLILRKSGRTIVAKGTMTVEPRIKIRKMGASEMSLDISEKTFLKTLKTLKNGRGELAATYFEERWLLQKGAKSFGVHSFSAELILRERGNWEEALRAVLGIRTFEEATIKRFLVDSVKGKLLGAVNGSLGDVRYQRIEGIRKGYLLTLALGKYRGSSIKAHLWLEDDSDKLILTRLEKESCVREISIPSTSLTEKERLALSYLEKAVNAVPEKHGFMKWFTWNIACGCSVFKTVNVKRCREEAHQESLLAIKMHYAERFSKPELVEGTPELSSVLQKCGEVSPTQPPHCKKDFENLVTLFKQVSEERGPFHPTLERDDVTSFVDLSVGYSLCK